MDVPRTGRSVAAVVTVVTAAAAGFAWWEGGLHRWSAAAHWSVAAVVIAVLLAAVVLGVGRQRQHSGEWLRQAARSTRTWVRRPTLRGTGAAVWVVLLAAVVAWDLHSFLRQSHDLPTLSRLFGAVTRFHWGRALVFLGWLAAGAAVVVGGRIRRRGPPC